MAQRGAAKGYADRGCLERKEVTSTILFVDVCLKHATKEVKRLGLIRMVMDQTLMLLNLDENQVQVAKQC